jgi:hypothetical protein
MYNNSQTVDILKSLYNNVLLLQQSVKPLLNSNAGTTAIIAQAQYEAYAKVLNQITSVIPQYGGG